MACWWRPMAARSVCRRPYAATMRRSPETGGRSRRRRDGLFAKEHGGETTKLSGSSRDVHDYLRALACSRHQRVAVPANRRLNNLREMSRSITRDKRRSVDELSSFAFAGLTSRSKLLALSTG